MDGITIIFASELKQLNSKRHPTGRLGSGLMQINMADQQNINGETQTNTPSTTMVIPVGWTDRLPRTKSIKHE